MAAAAVLVAPAVHAVDSADVAASEVGGDFGHAGRQMSGIRGFVVALEDATRPEVAEAMERFAAANFNVVYALVHPLVSLDGVRLVYPSKLAQQPEGLTGRDPLADLIIEAHRVGLEVMVTVEHSDTPATADIVEELLLGYDIDGVVVVVEQQEDMAQDFGGIRGRMKALDKDLRFAVAGPAAPADEGFALRQDNFHPVCTGGEEDYVALVNQLAASHFAGELRSMLAPWVVVSEGVDFRRLVGHNRMLGIHGEVLVLEDGIAGDKDTLATMHGMFYGEPMPLPYRDASAPRRPAGVITPVTAARTAGEWVVEPVFGPDYRVKVGGSNARVVFEAEVPTDGHYDIYMKLPGGGPGVTASATFVVPNIQMDTSKPKEERTVTGASQKSMANPMQMVQIDQSVLASEGWVFLAQVEIKGGVRYSALSLMTTEGSTENKTIAGPMMMLPNRLADRTRVADSGDM